MSRPSLKKRADSADVNSLHLFVCILTNSKYAMILSNHMNFYFCLRFNFFFLVNAALFECAACA